MFTVSSFIGSGQPANAGWPFLSFLATQSTPMSDWMSSMIALFVCLWIVGGVITLQLEKTDKEFDRWVSKALCSSLLVIFFLTLGLFWSGVFGRHSGGVCIWGGVVATVCSGILSFGYFPFVYLFHRGIARPLLEKRRAARSHAALTKRGDQQQRNDARSRLQSFWREHADILRDRYPELLLQSYMSVNMRDELKAVQVWSACHQLVQQLQPVIAQEKQRRERDQQLRNDAAAQRLARLTADIKACQAELEKLARSPLPPDVVAAERAALERQLRKLQRAYDSAPTWTPEDL